MVIGGGILGLGMRSKGRERWLRGRSGDMQGSDDVWTSGHRHERLVIDHGVSLW